MEEEGGLLENLRCKRTDGKQWRCKRRVWEGKSLCEAHYKQGRLRNNKEKVPEELKLQRAPTNSKKRNQESNGPQDGEVRAKKAPNFVLGKRERNVVDSEALDGAVWKLKLKKGDLQLDLIRGCLSREVGKLNGEGEEGEEVTAELPFGVMAITPPSPQQELDNASSYSNVKVGAEPSSIHRRRFRSKNLEPIPICTKQIVPFVQNVAKLKKKKKKKKKCHWCRQSGHQTLIQCLKCKKEYFCMDCINERLVLVDSGCCWFPKSHITLF